MIALDTNIYIYFLENNAKFFTGAKNAIKHALESGPICVPTITLMEILSGTPEGNKVLDFFSNRQFILQDFTAQLAIEAGKLRYHNKSLKSADAIHLSTALASKASQFITNDERLEKLQLGIEITSLKRYM